jgi:uncharacterized protein with FMN-binding domain
MNKKYILSSLVIITFITYAFYQQITGTDNSVAIKKSANTIPTAPVAQQALPVADKPKTTTTGGQYKDGTYTSSVTNAYYGNVQVEAIISGGKISDVQFLQYPQDRSRSAQISSHAMPILISEAIQAQSANVNTVSGATDLSGAFTQSLQSALDQAKNS